MFQRVRVRITILTVSLLLVLYTISSLAVFTIVHREVMYEIDTGLRTLVQHIVVPGPLPSEVYAMAYTNSLYQSDEMPAGLPNALLTLVKSEHRKQGMRDLQTGNASYRVLYVIHRSEDSNGTPQFIVLAENDTRQATVLFRLERVLFIVGAFGILASTLGGFYLAKRVLKPIHGAWNRQLEFVSNASHELRTPLAVIQSNLGIVMEHTDQTVVDNLEWLNNAHSESRRLTKLVSDLLTLARSDSEKSPINRQSINIKTLAEKVCDLYDPIAQMGQIHLKVDAPDDTYVIGDRDRLHQLFVILLDNAGKFTPSEGTITIRVMQMRNTVTIEVIDTGIGIAPTDLPRVFERFYTGDESRTRSDKTGTGLGLPIAKWIVEAHGGKIAIQSKGLNQGTVVKIELPASN